MSIYEQILNEDNSDSEAYWSLVLCRYGIEYVEDPTTHKRIPTINRAQYTSIYADEDYKSALQYASVAQKSVYEQEAKTIDEIQKGILAISEKEEPFDVFICYKETDDAGRRTPDSVLANELYHQLTQEGFKVFFSRITLEDKLGQEYEPYIFAALNSAKVMVVLGTKPEFFKAVWVRNEWSRYLALIKNGAQKMLIPAYKDMDPYDLPDEFSHLQAQDMSKLGFMQDLIRGIKKILDAEKEKQQPQKETVVVQQGSNGNVTALIKRGNMALEDGEWQKADEFFEEVLNQDAECAEAYLGKFLAKIQRSNINGMVDYYNGKKYAKYKLNKIVACEEDTEHIKEIIGKYTVNGYLNADDIANYYCGISREYDSELACRIEQKNLTLKSIDNEKLLVRARKYAKGEIEITINEAIDEITEVLDSLIEQAQNGDNRRIETIKKKYDEFIVEADKKVMVRYEKELKNREDKYHSLIDEFNKVNTSWAMKTIIDGFEKMHGYSESDEYIRKCRIKESKLKDEEIKAQEKEDMKAFRKEKKKLALLWSLAFILMVCVYFLAK